MAGRGILTLVAGLLLTAWCVLSFVFLVVAQGFVIVYEEPTLSHTFGDAYREYCRRVGRWLPIRNAVNGV